MAVQEEGTVMENGNTEAHGDIEYGQKNIELETIPHLKDCVHMYIYLMWMYGLILFSYIKY